MTLPDPLLVVAAVASALDAISVRYVVGGSVASMLYGIPRATQDVDLVAEMKAEHAEPFASRAGAARRVGGTRGGVAATAMIPSVISRAG